MAFTTLRSTSRSRLADIVSDSQVSTNSAVAIDGSTLYAALFDSLAYTFAVADNQVTVGVFGANAADFSDEVSVQSGDVASGASGSYAVAPPPYTYYRVKINSKVGGSHGTVTLRGIAK